MLDILFLWRSTYYVQEIYFTPGNITVVKGRNKSNSYDVLMAGCILIFLHKFAAPLQIDSLLMCPADSPSSNLYSILIPITSSITCAEMQTQIGLKLKK